MRKLLIILGAVGVITFATSCKKCATCNGVGEICTGQNGANQATLDAYKTSCQGNGGTYEEH